MSTTSATFRASGIASGMDTSGMIDQLVKISSQPIDLLRKRQAGMSSQVSALGDVISKLQELGKAAAALSDVGTLGTKVSSTTTGFSATSDAKALAGRYDVQVGTLAQAAQARSQSFTAPTDPVTGGTLTLNVQGTTYNIAIPDGAALADVALQIRQSGAPISATVLSNGTQSFLQLTNKDTGYPITGVPGDALSVSETSTGSLGQPLNLAINQIADNASLTVGGPGGLLFTRQTNTLTDVIPGVTLTLKSTTAAPESLVVDNDTEGTAKNLQKFIDAYNGVFKVIQSQLQPAPETDRTVTLAGDGALRNVQSSLQRLLTTQVGASGVRALADIGVKSNRDGSLTLDSVALGKAIGRDPAAVNNLFSQANDGLGVVVKSVVDMATRSGDGVLTSRKKSLSDNITRMDSQAETMQMRLDKYRDLLIAQFTAMEKVMSVSKATSNFLNLQTSSGSK
jgi:flagellar hook-associated protein 2